MGSPLPLGTQEIRQGVNFALISRHASRVRLELFDHPEDEFASPGNRSGFGAQPYGRRMACLGGRGLDPVNSMLTAWMALTNPSAGHRFNFNRLLLDPYATAISPLPPWNFASARGYDSDHPLNKTCHFQNWTIPASMPKVRICRTIPSNGTETIRRFVRGQKTVIYETHVRGFTIHPKSGVDHPGT